MAEQMPQLSSQNGMAKLLTSPNSSSARKNLRSFFLWLKLSFLLFLSLLSFLCFWVYTSPYVKSNSVITVHKGESTRTVLKRLHRKKILPHHFISLSGAFLFNGSTQILAGEYQIPQNATPRDVIQILNDGSSLILHKLTFPEGIYTQEILQSLGANPKLSGELLQAPPEGSLFPDTYHFYKNHNRSDFIKMMSSNMAQTTLKLFSKNQNPYIKTPQDLIIFASLLEREAATPQEMPRIAGVFVNRLKKRMRLQSDPTVVYALTEGKYRLNRNLKKDDLKIDSDYNTYRRHGLPKGPICCPGLSALKAATHPQLHNELYFVLTSDKTNHHFSRTYHDHVNYINQHLKLLRKSSHE